VYVFLFKSFPLFDRGSVNLRGEFHVENKTTFEQTGPRPDIIVEEMDIDDEKVETSVRGTAEPVTAAESSISTATQSGDRGDQAKRTAKTVTFTSKESKNDVVLDIDSLYPMFWSLQQDFAEPTRLFDASRLTDFKRGLDATIAKFRVVDKELENRGSGSKSPDEHRKAPKRKRGEGEDDLATGFNPKYLTSRDLFELEVSPRLLCFLFLIGCSKP
jgi:THO complex subunit 1